MESETFITDLLNSRNKKLKFNVVENVDDHIKLTIIKSLLPKANTRFKSVDEFKNALNKEMVVSEKEVKTQERLQVVKRTPGLGFNKIAGMDAIKSMIKQDVIDPLLHPEKNIEYGIEPPNGVLFYGPPGCGKTFFAECLADEVGFNFMKVNNDSYISSLILQRMMMQEEIDLQKAEELYNNFTEIIKKSSSSVNLKKGIDFMKESEKESPTIGFLAPNFSGPRIINSLNFLRVMSIIIN